MDKVILHIGDTVTHVTWGEGTVTDADEEFCTVRFAEKELTFRLPDAFNKGFLTSDDAEIIDENEDWKEEEEVVEEEEVEVDEGEEDGSSTLVSSSFEQLGFFGVLSAILFAYILSDKMRGPIFGGTGDDLF